MRIVIRFNGRTGLEVRPSGPGVVQAWRMYWAGAVDDLTGLTYERLRALGVGEHDLPDPPAAPRR